MVRQHYCSLHYGSYTIRDCVWACSTRKSTLPSWWHHAWGNANWVLNNEKFSYRSCMQNLRHKGTWRRWQIGRGMKCTLRWESELVSSSIPIDSSRYLILKCRSLVEGSLGLLKYLRKWGLWHTASLYLLTLVSTMFFIVLYWRSILGLHQIVQQNCRLCSRMLMLLQFIPW